MNFIERVMRVMTHLNIGAALGLAAWVLWSGWQVVIGQIAPGCRAAESTPASNHRRGLRLFVALHLGAVGAIYAVALVIGGGFAGPPMPPLAVSMAGAATGPGAVAATGAPAPASRVETPTNRIDPAPIRTPGPSTLPAWTQRAEVAAPWEAR